MAKKTSIPITPLTSKTFAAWLKKQSPLVQQWLRETGYEPRPGAISLVPDVKGRLTRVLLGVREPVSLWTFANLSSVLPGATYHIEGDFNRRQREQFALGWKLGSYCFARYNRKKQRCATLDLPAKSDEARLDIIARSIFLARDLINEPANIMTPAGLAGAAKEVAAECKAQLRTIIGDELLKANYPTIHAVGRASSVEPRLIDIRWGRKDAPKVTLVGKGVCFDSGGLDIKNAAGMRLMKKDMGGAAVVLALGRAIMLSKLNVQLRILIPAVENSIAGNAFRPLDVIKTRSGLTVEIGNTDAEGRLILCDALTEADSEKPDLLIDCATLTGAARVALGTDIPAFFTNDDSLADELAQHALDEHDPLWRLPLWAPYREMLNSPVADLNNAPDSSYAGPITAALYLKEFVKKSPSWVHLDMMAWNMGNRPGRPAGGEAMALRALYALIEARYGK